MLVSINGIVSRIRPLKFVNSCQKVTGFCANKRRAVDFFAIRILPNGWARLMLGAVPIILVYAVWTFLTRGEVENRIISPLILPSPQEVISSIGSLWFDAGLSRSVVASFTRVLGGFLVGLAVAFPLGLLMGAFTNIRLLFEPIVLFSSYLPIPALLPLTMSFFGIDELQKIMFLALAFIIYMLPLFIKALDHVDNIFLQTAYALGATKWQAVKDVLFRIAAPEIFQAMRFGFGVGWTYIMLAEMVAADRGLGQIIIVAQRRGPREHIYLILVVIVIIAYLSDRLWVKASKILFPYLENR